MTLLIAEFFFFLVIAGKKRNVKIVKLGTTDANKLNFNKLQVEKKNLIKI